MCVLTVYLPVSFQRVYQECILFHEIGLRIVIMIQSAGVR